MYFQPVTAVIIVIDVATESANPQSMFAKSGSKDKKRGKHELSSVEKARNELVTVSNCAKEYCTVRSTTRALETFFSLYSHVPYLLC